MADLSQAGQVQPAMIGAGDIAVGRSCCREPPAKLQKSLQPFMDAGRRTTQRRTAKASRGTGPRIDRAAVRAWATEQGLQVSERGRISAEVMSKYEAAH